MIGTPAFLDTQRPDVPSLVVSGGVVPFHLAHSPVRGRLVRLGPLAEALLSRHDNPESVSRLGGEALALVAAMAAALKFRGSLALQAKGDGPVPLLLADATSAGDLRFLARLSEETEVGEADSAAALLGAGYLAFTIDQGPDTERHQGIVEIQGGTLAEMAMHYFRTSEQHDCHIRLFCARTLDGWRAGALVLERVAEEGGIAPGAESAGAEDAWETAVAFAETLQEGEIFDESLASGDLIFRLFGTLDPLIAAPRALAFGCRCTRARLAGVLEGFSEDDLDHMVENGAITMNCEFCNIAFRFTRNELGERPA